MASQVATYQCPSCTAPLGFDAATGKLSCEFCGSSYEVEQMEALMAAKESEAVKAEERASTQPKSKPEQTSHNLQLDPSCLPLPPNIYFMGKQRWCQCPVQARRKRMLKP